MACLLRYCLQELTEEMMHADIRLMQKESWLKEGGYRTLNYLE